MGGSLIIAVLGRSFELSPTVDRGNLAPHGLPKPLGYSNHYNSKKMWDLGWCKISIDPKP